MAVETCAGGDRGDLNFVAHNAVTVCFSGPTNDAQPEVSPQVSHGDFDGDGRQDLLVAASLQPTTPAPPTFAWFMATAPSVPRSSPGT